ncbi:heme acquisition protein HasA [Achromobacter xylosoxidans]|uniref:heme acquisition protein HasA n=1 Tax=Alcaligenes xylosoxydans xylosoxydans TaxID=85698 RepID=UPI0012A990FF|nr:heme acquisition protein HasA [Achromobacter xylosoxidans]CUR66990.1 Heme-binding protein A (HasA) [Achromobacter xylosoxidans]
MTAFISYIDDHLSAATMEGSLREMLLAFQSKGVEGEHTNMPNAGGFFGGNMFNGTEYAYTSKTVANYAFVAEGGLHPSVWVSGLAPKNELIGRMGEPELRSWA